MSDPGLPELPVFRFPLTDRDVLALNDYTAKTRRLLDGQLTLANQRAQLLAVVIDWPNRAVPEVLTRPRLATRPASVTLVDARIGLASTTPAGIASSLEWDWRDGKILLPQFYEPTTALRWRLTLLVVEG